MLVANRPPQRMASRRGMGAANGPACGSANQPDWTKSFGLQVAPSQNLCAGGAGASQGPYFNADPSVTTGNIG